MAMYIYANLPKSYGSFYQIQQDNYPFNRIFHKYIRVLVDIGIEKELDIFSLIGYVEHGLSGDERLPDTPDGDRGINFRFSIEDEIVEDYYKEQDLSNKMITQMIVRMTIRLADEYGTSLSRIATMINQIEDQTIRQPQAKPAKRAKPSIRISNQPVKTVAEEGTEEGNDDLIEEIDEEEADDIIEEQKTSAESERLRKKLEELQKKQEELTAEEDDDQVVTTNPHLADFFG